MITKSRNDRLTHLFVVVFFPRQMLFLRYRFVPFANALHPLNRLHVIFSFVFEMVCLSCYLVRDVNGRHHHHHLCSSPRICHLAIVLHFYCFHLPMAPAQIENLFVHAAGMMNYCVHYLYSDRILNCFVWLLVNWIGIYFVDIFLWIVYVGL